MKKFGIKTILAVALSVTMLAGLTACGGSEDTENETTTKKEEVTTEKPTEEDVDLNTTLRLALNVMYNDADSAYYGNEVGPVINVTGDGQYTVTFDCGTNLSDTAKSAGVRGLKYLTSIYIKDYSVTNGALGASNLVSCDIKYDKIVVDGVELTINKTEAKNAIKDSGIFDTNDPINFWDGSAVDEVEYYDEAAHSGLITSGDNPQKIEVTFTLSNLKFVE